MGMVFKRIEKASVALACRDAASCDLGPRIGEPDTEDLKIIIRCSAGCVRAYDRVDFDKAAVDAVRRGSNGGPPDPRWVILGPLLRGKPCLACRRGSLQYAASFTPNRVFQQWILDPCVVMRTVNQVCRFVFYNERKSDFFLSNYIFFPPTDIASSSASKSQV